MVISSGTPVSGTALRFSAFQRVLFIASKGFRQNPLFMQERVKHTRSPRCTQTLGFLRKRCLADDLPRFSRMSARCRVAKEPADRHSKKRPTDRPHTRVCGRTLNQRAQDLGLKHEASNSNSPHCTPWNKGKPDHSEATTKLLQTKNPKLKSKLHFSHTTSKVLM